MTALTTTRATEILGCSPRTIGRMIADGTLIADKVHRRWAIDEAHCLKFAERYVNNRKPYRIDGGKAPGHSIIINPGSLDRARLPGGVRLALAIREIENRRPDLAKER